MANDLVELARRIAEVDINVVDQTGLAEAVGWSAQARARLDAFDVGVARRAAALASGGPSATAAAVTETLGNRGRRSGKDAKAAAERAGVCERMPGVESALADGAISAGHVDAIANATRGMDEARKAEFAGFTDDLLAAATKQPVGEFERECRDLAAFLSRADESERAERQRRDRSCRTWVDKVTGMHHLYAQLDPEAGAKVAAALQAKLASICARPDNAGVPLEALRADALCELAQRGTGERGVPEISVLVDWQTLTDGVHDQSLCETQDGVRLPVATVRRLCCDADLLPVVLGGDGFPLDVGRTQRTATWAQRRALAAIYRTCGVPGCEVAFGDCQIHHVHWWEHLGPTDLANLIPTCSRHHHLVHEGGWHLAMDADRTVTLTRPDGTTALTGPSTDRPPPQRRAA